MMLTSCNCRKGRFLILDYYFEAAKEKLNKVRKIQFEIDSRKAEIEQLSVIAFGCQSNISGMPRGGGTSDKVGDTATKIADLQLEIRKEMNLLIDAKMMCLQAINRLDDTRLRSVLIQYYVTGQTWSQIAENMDITEQWAQKLRNAAINVVKHYFEEIEINSEAEKKKDIS